MHTIKGSVWFIANAVLAGCAVQGEGMTGGLAGDGADPEEAQAYVLDGDGVSSMRLGEQWLRFESLMTGAPITGLQLCDQWHPLQCAGVDGNGDLRAQDTPFGQGYRMIGSNGSNVKFVLIDQAQEHDVNRLLRPIRVMNDAQIAHYYGTALTKRHPEHHTVIARARVANGCGAAAIADEVRFELRPVQAYDQTVRLPSYPNEDGVLDGSLEASVRHGHAVFLDVPAGRFDVYAERDGKPCSRAQVWLDGVTQQVVLPELVCD